MRIRMLLAGVLVLSTAGPRASAAINLELKPPLQEVQAGEIVQIGLYAVSSTGANEDFSALDVILSWDARYLELVEALDNGPHVWSFVFGFPPDSGLDGLNDTFTDGTAFFQAASFSAATATAAGVLVATLRFVARNGVLDTPVVIESEIGGVSKTAVFEPGGPDVTGELLGAAVTIIGSIPTVSEWGLVVLGLLVLVAGTIVLDRPRASCIGAWSQS